MVLDSPAGGTAWWGTAQTLFFLALAASWLTWLEPAHVSVWMSEHH